MIKLYTVKNCKYCEEAKKWLTERNIQYEIIDLSSKENREARNYYRGLGVNIAPIITGITRTGGEWVICGFKDEDKKNLEKLIYD